MSRRTTCFVLVLAAVALLSALTRADDAKLDLRLRLEPGKSYRLVVTIEQHIRQLVEGREQAIDQTVTIGQRFDAKQVGDDGVATIEVTFDRFAMRASTAGMTMTYDSADPPDEILPAARPLAAMVGRSFAMRLRPDGALVELKGVEAMIEAALKVFVLTEAQRTRLRENLEQQFGAKALRELVTSTFKYMPERPVNVGDMWSRTVATAGGYPATFETAYKLTARNDGIATIEAKTKITPNADAPPQKLGSSTVRYKLAGTQEGTVEIDEATGWYVGGTMIQKTKGEMMVSGLPGQPPDEEIEVPIIIESTITLAAK